MLEPVVEEANLSKFRGQSCVIDIMGWLYKGAFQCASLEGHYKDHSLIYMCYPLKMLQLLKSHEIEPICIFDGRGIPGKESCLQKRSVDKAKNRE